MRIPELLTAAKFPERPSQPIAPKSEQEKPETQKAARMRAALQSSFNVPRVPLNQGRLG